MTAPRRAALVAGLLAAVVAAPSLRNGFVGDDRWIIAERPLLRDPPSVAAVLGATYWPAGFGGTNWRPAVLGSYALDYRISASPHWFHAVNVLWAAVATALLTYLACLITTSTTSTPSTPFTTLPVGLTTGLLFAVHPVHVEAVANVVGRAELMAAAGYGAALICAVRAQESRRWWLLGVAGASALAIGSKEHAATLPAAILLIAVARRDRAPLRSALPVVVVAAVPIAAYFLVRGTVVEGGRAFYSGGLAVGLEGLNPLERAWGMLAVSLEWWRLLLVPARLSADYSPAEVVVRTDLTIRHVAAAIVWGGVAWAAWRWRRTAPGGLVALGLAWVIVTLVPVSNVLIPTEIVLAERTLYLPSWGVALALAGAAAALPSAWPVRARAALLGIVLLAGGARSIARVGAWRDDEAAFRAAVRDAPRSYRTRWMLGRDEFAAGRWGAGERLLREAVALAPQVNGPRMDLARAYVAAGLWGPAAAVLRDAIAVDSGHEPAWALLPQALRNAGDTAAAAQAAEAARRFVGRRGGR